MIARGTCEATASRTARGRAPAVLDEAGRAHDLRGRLGGDADFDNVMCKLSGLVIEVDWRSWDVAALAPYAGHFLSCFGAERVMFGSDGPACEPAASYGQVVELARSLTGGLSMSERDLVFEGTARAAYALHV
ncbi:amidohydrolase family protein [Sphaerisporangium sp. NPDC051017]|uniref:amidohydrolase family protein n=1 Tax=Sphaerisporangium sp. NPDC051017 TaxID=3154636 RepID=UPI00341AAA6E